LHNREIQPRYVLIGYAPVPLGENSQMEPIEPRRLRTIGIRECLMTALVLYSLSPRDASAGDQTQSPDARRVADVPKPARLQLDAPFFPAQYGFSTRGQEFSATEFRPRKAGLLEAAAGSSETPVIDARMLRDTSIARELSEAKTQDRVRLLTLWQSRASSLSLQAGKGGAPSLQWSTPWMHRDADSRGLFDRLLRAGQPSFGGAMRSGASRPAAAISPGKPLELVQINNK
jgi:hypothetical protein